MYKTDLVDARGTSPSIWVDLKKYPTPRDSAYDALGLSEDQLTFIRSLVLTDESYLDTYTTLYYRYCSMRVKRYIPRTFAKVIASRYPYMVMEPVVEEMFDLPVLKNFDTRPYRTITPDSVVVSFPREDISGERIIVHRGLTTSYHLVQYRYRQDVSYPLLKRLESLCRNSDSILVTNTTLREMLRIKS